MERTIDKIEGQDYVYHRFTFDTAIQDHTFIGDEFIGMNPADESETMEIFDRCAEAGPDGFMPNLVEEIKKVIGKENYIYDGYEIGEEDFGLYFFIKADIYESTIEKIKLWSNAVDIDKFIWWEGENN